ncbi:MFS transporter [Saccharopolyspora sp. HNM0983]|uniref:MFS transporter n=1 Tax=Saccharopolyspora montiporae TaxID=2781240 RepID=A0A929BBR8_9PSEU|nr:MFS transporter [Saccharopolyspora sp. HNM0983]MBE9374748.1 MFS transporter [Saccharopolyspora sp. HNM0983]
MATISSRLTPTREILTTPSVARLLSASLVGRLPTGMAALAILLSVRAHDGSYTLAGALSAIYAASAAVGGPLLGRLIDRTRQPPTLIISGLISAAAFIGLAAVDPTTTPVTAMGLAAAAGAATPQLEPCLRVLWSPVLRDEHAVRVAYSLDAATQELIFVVGPLVVLATSALADPGIGLVTAGVLGITGSLWFATAAPARQWRGAPTTAHWAGPLRSVSLVRLLTALLFVGATIGAFTVGITAYAEHSAAPAAAGWLIAANAVGALAGGIAYTMLSAAGDEHRRLQLLLCALGLGYAPLVIQLEIPAMAVLAILSGLALPPVLACSFALIGQLAPEGTITEAHAWMITAFGAGNAAGSALAGFAADTVSSRLALAASVAMATVALVVAAPSFVRPKPRTKQHAQ